VRSSEWVAFVYFAVLAGAAWVRSLPAARRASIAGVGVTMCVAIVGLSRYGTGVQRDWAPVAIILVGYYLSGRFFSRPSITFENWLASWDRKLLGEASRRFESWPAVVVSAVELTYMGTFLLIPLGCAVLVYGGRSADLNRYWTMVTAAEFGAFGPLAFVQTRPPWALESARGRHDSWLRGVGLFWVRHTSHCANTFPSGHAAGSLAVALAVLPVMPIAGIMLLMIALMISVGCVTGRYHYVVDVIAGVALALAIFLGVQISVF
jgi:membrane-associated phospholipid phosphatase